MSAAVTLLPCIGPINPDFVDLFRVLSQVFDMAKDMTPFVLTDKVSEVGAKAHISNSRFMNPPFLNRKAFEQDEPFPIQ